MSNRRITEATHAGDGTKTISQINRELQEVYDGQPLTVHCAWCPWTFEGAAGAAREAAAFHRASEHPGEVNGATPRQLLDSMDAGESVAVETGPADGAHEGKWSRDEIVEAIKAWAVEHGKPPTSTEWRSATPDRPSADRVKRRFGSWGDGIVAAGFERPTRGHRRAVEASAFPPSVEELKPEPARKPRRVRKAKTAAAKPPARLKTVAGLVEIVASGAGSFAGRCELEAERHETAAAAYRQIAGGIRALEELAA